MLKTIHLKYKKYEYTKKNKKFNYISSHMCLKYISECSINVDLWEIPTRNWLWCSKGGGGGGGVIRMISVIWHFFSGANESDKFSFLVTLCHVLQLHAKLKFRNIIIPTVAGSTTKNKLVGRTTKNKVRL